MNTTFTPIGINMIDIRYHLAKYVFTRYQKSWLARKLYNIVLTDREKRKNAVLFNYLDKNIKPLYYQILYPFFLNTARKRQYALKISEMYTDGESIYLFDSNISLIEKVRLGIVQLLIQNKNRSRRQTKLMMTLMSSDELVKLRMNVKHDLLSK